MHYYKAYETANKPFVTWCGVGSFATTEAFEASRYYGDPLVVPQTSIVAQDGVFTLHVVSGVLVAWTAPELTAWRTETNIEKALRSESQRIVSINNDKFTYDGKEFPMDEVSRLFYKTLEVIAPSSSKIRTMANTAYDLNSTDIVAFMLAYRNRLLIISKPAL
ncbi:hypothetical protein [Flavobacterium sp.]